MSRTAQIAYVGALLLLILAPGLTFGQETPVPDTLDWRRYFPMEVGNQWHYEISSLFPIPQIRSPFFRWRIVSDSLVEDQMYFLFDSCTYDETLSPNDCLEGLLRYDTTHANVVMRRTLDDGQMRDEWFGGVPCGLDAPFGAVHMCTGVDVPTAFSVGGGVISVL